MFPAGSYCTIVLSLSYCKKEIMFIFSTTLLMLWIIRINVNLLITYLYCKFVFKYQVSTLFYFWKVFFIISFYFFLMKLYFSTLEMFTLYPCRNFKISMISYHKHFVFALLRYFYVYICITGYINVLYTWHTSENEILEHLQWNVLQFIGIFCTVSSFDEFWLFLY